VPQERERIDPKGLGDLKELDHIQASFAAFKLRYIGLGAIQPLRQGRLR
jgi:hypothetical protein